MTRPTPIQTNSAHEFTAKLLCRVTWVVLPRNEEISSAQGVITRGRPEYTARFYLLTAPSCDDSLCATNFFSSGEYDPAPARRMYTYHTAATCLLVSRYISWRNPLAIHSTNSTASFGLLCVPFLRFSRLKVGLREFWNIKFCFWAGQFGSGVGTIFFFLVEIAIKTLGSGGSK